MLFFTRGTAKNPQQEESCTKEVWVYDLRTNMPSFGKRTPFSQTHLQPFEKEFSAKKRKEIEGEEPRWRCFTREWIKDQKGDSLDIAWLKDENSVDAASLPEPDVLAAEAMSELTEAMRELNALMISLGAEDEAFAQQEVLIEALGLEWKE